MGGSRLGKEDVKAVYCQPAHSTSVQSVSWECWAGSITRWDQVARRNVNNLRFTDDTTLMAEGEEKLKGLLMTEKVKSEKSGLKLNIQKT